MLHLKGDILCALRQSAMWDTDLVAQLAAAHGLDDAFGHGTIRLALIELSANGLIVSTEERLLDNVVVIYCYRVTDFGRRRMVEARLRCAP